MKCPFCFYEETKVVDKRETEDFDVTRRRRECLKCKKRFTTYERVEDLGLIIVKKDGRRESFDPEKIKRGILKACEKRPVSCEQVDDIVNKVEAELRKLKSKEVASSVIGEKIVSKLKKLDKIAYIRFASVYRSFADVTDFEKELKDLVKKR
ncbi:MAG: Transcriptional repressor NrdR [archaeon GW2011_AR20]|nr:MAG: Transcriptional repressor NrdR [archaeon GW2011_AR20]MBS3160710.1 transcriptional regulator NrdR [Candidatus Woesearchaeota archaeon]